MKDTFSMVVAVIFLVILLIILPLYNYFERQDDMSYNMALKTVTMFVDEVVENGYIDQNMYDKFIQRLGQTGNSYDIQIEAKKKILTTDIESAEERYDEQYKSYFNKDIFNDETGKTSNVIAKDNSLKNDVFFLDKGDKFYVRVKNTNTTMASALLNTIVSGAAKEKVNIIYGATVKNNNWEKTDISQLYQSDILIKISLEDGNDPNDSGLPEYSFDIAHDRIIKFKIKILNDDDTNIASKITDNIRLIGTMPSCYISPSGISEVPSGEDGEYIVTFTLDETKANTYFLANEYNVLQCFLPANSIQGKFSKNASVSSEQIVIKIDSTVTVPEL